MQHSIPPRKDVSSQLVESCVGAELSNESSIARWRHAEQFIGFDADESSSTKTLFDQEFDENDLIDELLKVFKFLLLFINFCCCKR